MKPRASTTLSGMLLSLALAFPVPAASPVAPPTFEADGNWLKLPEGRTEIGSMHGDVAVSASGDVYISVEGTVRQRFAILGPNPGLQVYSADGTYLRNVPDAPFDLHGFVIRSEAGGEFLYGVRLAGGTTPAHQSREGLEREVIVKMTLEGQRVLAIPAASIPDQYKSKSADGRAYLRLTGIAVAPNGDIYVSDGYASDYVHRFDRNGRYLASFGGKQPPYGFRTLHKITMDTRHDPARLIGIDRENSRLVHLSLDGALLGVIAGDLLRPAAAAVHGENLAVTELRGGRITLLDAQGRVVTRFGTNTEADEVNVNTTPPEKWRPGAVTAPHGIAFTPRGELLVSEFNLFGRVHRFLPTPSAGVR